MYLADKKLGLGKVFKRCRRKLLQMLINLMPIASRRKLYLRKCGFLAHDILVNQVSVTIERNQESLEAILKLVGKAYHACRFLSTPELGKKTRAFNLAPTTAAIVARHAGKDVGALFLVADSERGLPAESCFSDKVNELRAGGRRIAEISSFAIDDDFRGKGLLLYLGNVAERYAHEAGYHEICIAVPPSCVGFYKDVLFYRKVSEIRNYGTSDYDPLVLMAKCCRANFQKFYNTYGSFERRYNLYRLHESLSRNKLTMQSIAEHIFASERPSQAA